MQSKVTMWYKDIKKLDVWEILFLIMVLSYAFFSTIDIKIVNIINICMLLLFLKSKKYCIKNNKINILDKLLFFYSLLIIFRFLFNNGEELKGSIMAEYLAPIILFYIVRSIKVVRKYFKLIVAGLFISIFISVAYSFFDAYQGVARVDGFIFVMEFAEFAAMFSLGLIIVSLFKLKRMGTRLLLMGLSTLGFISMVMTKTRGVWLAYIFSMLIILLLRRKKYMMYFLILISILSSIIFLGDSVQESRYYKRLISIKDIEENASNTTRLRLWMGSMKIIEDNPFLGIGLNSFGDEISKPKYDQGKIVSTAHAHNNYLQIGVSTGIMGMILLILIHLYIIYYLIINYKTHESSYIKKINLLVLSFWLIYILHGLTEFTIEDMYTGRFVWFSLGLTYNLNNKKINKGVE